MAELLLLLSHNAPLIDLHILWPIRLGLSAFAKLANVNKPCIFYHLDIIYIERQGHLSSVWENISITE